MYWGCYTYDVLKVFLAKLTTTCLPSIASGGFCACRKSCSCLAEATEPSSIKPKHREVLSSSRTTCVLLMGSEVSAAMACRMPCSLVKASRSRNRMAGEREGQFHYLLIYNINEADWPENLPPLLKNKDSLMNSWAGRTDTQTFFVKQILNWETPYRNDSEVSSVPVDSLFACHFYFSGHGAEAASQFNEVIWALFRYT